MKLASDSFGHRDAIPTEFAMGTPEGFGGNRNPHLAWSDPPPGTRSFVVLCVDADAPTNFPLNQRKLVARRALMEVKRGDVGNVGVEPVYWINR